jgi:hypothetical protein
VDTGQRSKPRSFEKRLPVRMRIKEACHCGRHSACWNIVDVTRRIFRALEIEKWAFAALFCFQGQGSGSLPPNERLVRLSRYVSPQ